MNLATWRFSLGDQRQFARLSGDHNPVHVDPVEARRIAVGEPIVHGVHLLLKALDAVRWTAGRAGSVRIGARFLRPALLGDAITVSRAGRDGGRVILTAPGGDAVAEITIGGASKPLDSPADANRRTTRARVSASRATPRTLTLDQMADASGAIALPNRRAGKHFPRVTRLLGADAVASLLSISRLVGMECPGRDSLLSTVDLEILPHASAKTLEWRVTRIDSRFRLVRITIASGGVHGVIEAFVRRQPTETPDIGALTERVAADAFAGQRALIIGGSRGLGAAAALLVAVGGGTALATYARGRKEAAALRRAARAAGRQLEITPFDVLADPPARLAALCTRFRPTHVYYCATPRIFVRRQVPFDDALFRTFADFYLAGFTRVCTAAHAASSSVTVWYPSTVAVADSPSDLIEYAAAKAAGEVLCRSLDRPADGLRVTVSQLPRIRTDQTASLIAVTSIDPVDAMLPILRDLHPAGLTEGRR